LAVAEHLRALTLWRPWGVAIVRHGKRIENRTWAPPRWLIGKDIAIHNGKRVDREGIAALMSILRGERTAFAMDAQSLLGPEGAVIGVARVTGFVEESASPWFCGPVGWTLDNVRECAPIPCRGAQGLWMLPADVEEQVRSSEAFRG
jgi:hypothetical protein